MKFVLVAGLALTIAAKHFAAERPLRENQGLTCQTVAGASLDYPAAFVVDPPYPAVPTVLDSSQAFSARTEGARLKVSRFFYVKDVTADPSASVGNVLAVWKRLADDGKISSQVESRTVSGIEGNTAQATFSLQGQAVRGQVLSVGRDRTLWEFISVYPDTPSGRALIQQTFASIKVPGSCG
jgi:hypothetical protein